jgi:hypothetical protein
LTLYFERFIYGETFLKGSDMGRQNSSVYNWGKMEVGDVKSFGLLKGMNARVAAHKFAERHDGFKFESERVESKIIVKRVA